MKKLILNLCLLFNAIVFSQTNQSYSFDSYFIKSKDLTADRIVKFYQTLQIENLGNKQYIIKGEIGPRDNLIATLIFTEKSFFAGTTYFQYDGQGLLSGKEVRIIIESGSDLEDFSTGIGYKEYSNDDLSLFEIKFYYWPFEINEPLLKDKFYLYQITNKTQELGRDYIQVDDYKMLNLDHVIKRVKSNSKITGTYELEDYASIRAIELENNQIVFSLSFGAIGYIEGLTTLDKNTTIFESNDFGICNFQMTFDKDYVIMKNLQGDGSGDCGFGNRAYISDSDTKYLKISSVMPNIREDR